MRVITALLVAPLFPAFVVAMVMGIKFGGFDSEEPAALAWGCVVAGYAAAIVFGLPLSFLWKRLGFNGVLGGVGLGVVSAACMTLLVAYALSGISRAQVSFFEGLFNLLVVACPVGAIGGLAFWWFALRNPGNRLERDDG